MDVLENSTTAEHNNTADIVQFYKTKDGNKITTNDLFKHPSKLPIKPTENTKTQNEKHKQKRQRTSTSLPNSSEPNFNVDNPNTSGVLWTKVQQSKPTPNGDNHTHLSLPSQLQSDQKTKTPLASLNQLSLFLKGENKSIINHVSKPHTNFEKEVVEQFGVIHNKKDDYIKIICTSLKQKEQILKSKTIAKVDIHITLPKCLTQNQHQKDNQSNTTEQDPTNKHTHQYAIFTYSRRNSSANPGS